jgi:excisionase family DNA binding protein
MIAAQQLASKLCLTIAEAAEFAGVSKKLIHDACEDGTLDAFRDGRVWRIPRTRLVARYGSPQP